jgi:hypothetical protein
MSMLPTTQITNEPKTSQTAQREIPMFTGLPDGQGMDTSEYIGLPRGKELDDAAAVALAKSRPVRWIVLAGPIESGKTTLLVSLYELFQWRRVEGFAFGGSNTLPAFEERSFLSRKDSGNVIPHTSRTKFTDLDPLYLHLRIRWDKGLKPFTDFLCTDVSGEMYEHARDSTHECKEMIFIKRANHFVLLLDSAKGVQSGKRWAMVEDARALLRSCVDSNMIRADCLVQVVWSRFDYFVEEEANRRHQVFRTNVESELRGTFGKAIPKLVFGQVAARPLRARQLGIGYGVCELLKQWAVGLEGLKEYDLCPRSYAGSRESELFAARHFRIEKSNE